MTEIIVRPSQRVAVAMATVGSHEFIATGPDKRTALDCLMDVWRTHADQVGADPDYLSEADATVVEGPLGSGFRDGEIMPMMPAWEREFARKLWKQLHAGQ